MNSGVTALVCLCYISSHHGSFSLSDKKVTLLPWMGVLLYKPDNHSLEEVTNIVMIEHRTAITNAKEIGAVKWDLLKKSSRAMFYNRGAPWFCGLTGHILHPEYEQGYLNTVAILFLESVSDSHLWKPIGLIRNNKEISRWNSVYNVGYTDRRMLLEQEIFPLEYVSRMSCDVFFDNEEINFDFLWPPNAICYKKMKSKYSCVINAGMALASNFTNDWILMGLSTHGPGCLLPARYIDIFPYIKWINDQTEVRKSTRRWTKNHQAFYDVPGYKSTSDMLFNKLKGSQGLSAGNANKIEIVKGCTQPEDKENVMYREEDIFDTSKPSAIGIYSEGELLELWLAFSSSKQHKVTSMLLFFDTNFKSATCVQVYTFCKARSKLKLSSSSKVSQSDLELFGKTVPSGDKVRDYVKEDFYMMITDPLLISDKDIYNLEFMFEFDYFAMVNVTFYGKENST